MALTSVLLSSRQPSDQSLSSLSDAVSLLPTQSCFKHRQAPVAPLRPPASSSSCCRCCCRCSLDVDHPADDNVEEADRVDSKCFPCGRHHLTHKDDASCRERGREGGGGAEHGERCEQSPLTRCAELRSCSQRREPEEARSIDPLKSPPPHPAFLLPAQLFLPTRPSHHLLTLC